MLFSWLALGQSISPGQLVGVGMAVIGGFILSVNEYILECFGCAPKVEDDNETLENQSSKREKLLTINE